MCVSGADEPRGALGVAIQHGDGRQAAEAFERHRPDDHVAAEAELLAERGGGGAVSPPSSAARPALPLWIIRANGRPSARTAGVARAAKSLASRSAPRQSAAKAASVSRCAS